MQKNDPGDALPPAFHDAVAQSKVMNMGYVAEAAKRVDGLDAERKALLRSNVELLAQAPPTREGVEQALAQLDAQATAFPDDKRASQTSGTPPGLAAMVYAGMCVIHGLVAQAARASDDDGAAALLRTISQSPTVDARDRGLLSQEVQLAVGRQRYMKALEASKH